MRVRLKQGRVARARNAHEDSDQRSAINDQGLLTDEAITNTKNPRALVWPRYFLDWDDRELVPRIVDVDAAMEWDGWRCPELEGGDL